MELTSFTINVDAAPDLTALVGGERVSILSLDLSGLTSSVKGRRVTLGGVKASLTAAAAGALNGAFGVTAFTEGLVLGTATVSAQAEIASACGRADRRSAPAPRYLARWIPNARGAAQTTRVSGSGRCPCSCIRSRRTSAERTSRPPSQASGSPGT